MAFRYKLRSFPSKESQQRLLEEVWPYDAGLRLLVDCRESPWRRVIELLEQLGAESLLFQREVRDQDFLDEHQAFYAKQHRPVDRSCVRIHAFKIRPLDAVDGETVEQNVLRFIDEAAKESDAYLGFVTVRPLRHAPVGGTIIRPLEIKATHTADGFPVHIAGNEFSVTGVPFLQQDNAVGACAQASIWMALRVLRRRHGNAAYSPAELTIAGTKYLANDRVFPGRQGLTIQQMLEAVRFSGHDPLHIHLRRIDAPPLVGSVAISKIIPYLESGLPVVLAIVPPSKTAQDGHAVVAIGFSYANKQVYSGPLEEELVKPSLKYLLASRWVSSLTVHDDSIGPYISMDPASNEAYSLAHMIGFIAILPDCVFTTAEEAELLGARAVLFASLLLGRYLKTKPSFPQIPIVLRPVLCARHAFREWAKNDESLDPAAKQIYRTHDLPKYVWVLEMHDERVYDPTCLDKKSRCGEIVLDASADPLHADGLVFVRGIADMWPGMGNKVQGFLVTGYSGAHEMISLASGHRGPRLDVSWK